MARCGGFAIYVFPPQRRPASGSSARALPTGSLSTGGFSVSTGSYTRRQHDVVCAARDFAAGRPGPLERARGPFSSVLDEPISQVLFKDSAEIPSRRERYAVKSHSMDSLTIPRSTPRASRRRNCRPPVNGKLRPPGRKFGFRLPESARANVEDPPPQSELPVGSRRSATHGAVARYLLLAIAASIAAATASQAHQEGMEYELDHSSQAAPCTGRRL